jgi:hypothetical protein
VALDSAGELATGSAVPAKVPFTMPARSLVVLRERAPDPV